MYGLTLAIYLGVTISLILIILLQKSPGIAIQAKSSFTGPRSRANILTRITGILAAAFMGLCLLLTRQNVADNKIKQAIIAKEKAEQTQKPLTTNPANIPLKKLKK